MRLSTLSALLSASSLALGAPGALAAPRVLSTQPDKFALGRNVAHDPCFASRDWRDPATTEPTDYAWSITCRNVTASRVLGTIRAASSAATIAAALKALDCGETQRATLPGIGSVDIRRCYDALLGGETAAYSFKRGGRTYLVSAAPNVLGPAEEGARIVARLQPANGDPGRDTSSPIDYAALPTSPSAVRSQLASGSFDPNAPLGDGIILNHKGLHVEASRVLNDALSRLPADTPPATRAELLLEAALADSNIRFTESAEAHFHEADAAIAKASGERVAFVIQKRDAYRALDLINQRRFREALTALDKLAIAPAPSNEPLRDPTVVRQLNQQRLPAGDAANAVAVPDTAANERQTLDAQINWARSVCLLALGDENGAQGALARARAAYDPLVADSRTDPRQILWLGARIERQSGRLQARHKQYPEAIASFDRALDDLRRGSLLNAGAGNEPGIAETQLERAGIVADQGGDPARVRAEYDAAVTALIAASQSSGGILPLGMERYLDLLVADAQGAGGGQTAPDTYERFFRAMQAVGEPATARQLSQLQTIVTADPEIGAKVRDRTELEATITRLRYAIAAGGDAGTNTAPADLEKQRQDAEAKLAALDAELGKTRLNRVDDSPATIAEVRRSLRPGEAFMKVSELNRQTYGIVIAADQTWIYKVAAPKAALDALAGSVRASIDGQYATKDVLVPFDVASSAALFGLVTGPAQDAVLKASALVIDPAGPLESLPAAVLVTNKASVERYSAQKKAHPFDFSMVDFLAARTPISTAVSPRSFLVARALPPSAARQPFLGLGDHQPALGDGGPPRLISVGFGCIVQASTLADLSRRLRPIDKAELDLAARSLGVANPPEMVGPAFSDTAIEGRTDLANFEVLHFATHGLQEGVWGCEKSPPALVTSFGDSNSDGLLSFDEVAKLRLDANLVVLSACDTASGVRNEALARQSGQEEAGSTLEGLVRAFLTANSRAVLATYWPASAEQDTDLFIETFYGSARRETIGASLQAAQHALIVRPEFSHPFHWAPYFVVGDSTKMMLSAPVAVAAK